MTTFDRSGLRPGVTFACLYQTHSECRGVRMVGGLAVGECCCPCHHKEQR